MNAVDRDNLKLKDDRAHKPCNEKLKQYIYFFPWCDRQEILIIEVSRAHSHTTVGRTPLDGVISPSRGIHLTTHSTHKRQTSMPPAVCAPTIPAIERRQTHALDRAATRISEIKTILLLYLLILLLSSPNCN